MQNKQRGISLCGIVADYVPSQRRAKKQEIAFIYRALFVLAFTRTAIVSRVDNNFTNKLHKLAGAL